MLKTRMKRSIRQPIMPLPQAFGWEPDPPEDIENKDWQLSSSLSGDGVVQDEMDISAYFRPVSDQMAFPSCAANACVDVWESAIIVDKVKAGMGLEEAVASTPDLSRMFAWWYGRNAMDPCQSANPASGCFLRLIMDTLARFGAPREATWPYTAEFVTRRPTIRAQREAFVNRSDAFYTIGERGDKLFELLRLALAERRSIAFGTKVGAELKVYRGGVLEPPATSIGGHAMAIVGWSTSLNAFKVRNSWSKAWGIEGHCWLSKKYICDYSETGAFWVVTKGML